MALIITLILLIPFFASLWVIFQQKGLYGWEAIISPWNIFRLWQIIGKPWWWLLLLCVPFINIFMLLLMLVRLSEGFKRNKIWEYFVAAILPFIYFPILVFVYKEKYTNPKDLPKFKKSVARDWFDAIIFAVVAATIVRTFFFENYTIPTSSMEKSMLVGDFVYVSKMAYGPRIPMTPLSFPLVHHTIPILGVKSYVDGVHLDYKRFFNSKTVQKGDAVVFNFPVGDTVSTAFQSTADYYALCRDYGRERVLSDRQNFGEIIVRPIDKKENFVKRCVATAGDTIEIRDRVIYINGVVADIPEKLQFNYVVYPTPQVLSRKVMQQIGVSNEDLNIMYKYGIVPLTGEMAEQVRALNKVDSVVATMAAANQRDERIFPFDERYNWNVDNFGPLYVPAKGATIAINIDNLPLYKRAIEVYENHSLDIKGNDIYVDGVLSTTYTFSMDYYWMMGDNRHNSADSRYWGFVPEDHIVGKAQCVWFSWDKDKKFPKSIRWSKLIRWNF